MNNALSIVDNNNLTMWENQKNLEEIRKLFAPKLTETEFQFFVGLGKATQLNPFTREIWCVKYQENTPAQVFVGRDGYRKAAQRHHDYDYHQCDAVYENDLFKVSKGEVEHSYTLKNRGELIGAYCIAKRRNSEKPIYLFAELKEYSTGKSLWNSATGKPATMIKKVAESQCLRACFQDLLGGTYGEEEMSKPLPQRMHVVDAKTQTERLKNILKENDNVIDMETGEILEDKSKIHNTGRDDIPINDEQLDQISSIMSEKGFTEERIRKALNYHEVEALEELTDAQARLLLLQLGRA
jgi:phage recombination protein Bet